MDDFELELKTGFLEEANQILADCEQSFLNLESSHEDPEILVKLFRLAHNLKGSAGAVGFPDVVEFTHKLESLLLKLKNREMAVNKPIVDLLLRCNDHLLSMFQTLQSDLNAKIDSSALMAELQVSLDGGLAAAPAAEATPEPVVEDVPAEVPPEQDPHVLAPPASAFEEPTAPAQTEATPAATEFAPPPPAQPPQAPPSSSAPSNGTSPTAATGDESIRVSLRRIEKLMNNVGELVIFQEVLNQQKVETQSTLIQKTISQLAKVTREIQDISMSLRLVSLKQTFQKMQRIVRDTSGALGKDVQFEITGEDTEIDKTILESLGDPLVHLIRNAVDHGLEMPDEREAAGKSRTGHIRLSAAHRGGHIVIEVVEDGRGMDPAKLIAKAIEKGILKPGAKLADRDAYRLIFAPGFSTKTAVTDISGRGVGLDVVKTNIERLQGEVQLETVLGKGTTFRILLPLTLAIIDGMIITVGDERYVVPITQVHETLQPTKEDLHKVTGMGDVFSLRGEQLPLYRLSDVLGKRVVIRAANEAIVIVVRSGEKPFSILVDDIVGQQQVVIKRLGKETQNLKGVSGGAILGDGRAALILDFPELVTRTSNSKPIRGAA